MTIGGTTDLGYRSFLGIATETTYGTAGTSPSFMEFVSNSLKLDIEELKSPAINTSRSYTRRFQMNRSVEGSVEYHLHPVDGIPILQAALGGTATVTAGSTGVYTHTLVPGNSLDFGSTGKSLTFDVRKGSNLQYRYNGCRVNQVTVKAEINQPIIITADIVGQNSTADTTSTETTISFSSARPFLFKDGSFKFADTAGSATAAGAEESVMGFELTINNNLVSDDNVRAIGTDTVVDLAPGMRDISLKLTMRADTSTVYDRFIGGTAGAVNLDFTSDEAIAGSSANNYQMSVLLPKVYYNASDIEVGGPDVLTVEPEISAISNATSPSNTAYDMQVTLVNDVASYS